ncbi:MAG: FG-GAP-like repeat-containing protein [Nitrospirales bacterium]
MERRSAKSALNSLGLTLISWLLFTGLTSSEEMTPTVTLKQPVHFTASDGSDIVVDSGSYTVSALVGPRLRLNGSNGGTIFLAAQATTHSEGLEAPLAIVVPGDDPDVVHVALLLPNGQALDALGSFSGVRPRGVNAAVLSAANFQAILNMQLHTLPPTFFVISYGDKCLDFGPPPHISGAPVFIYGCNGTIAQQVEVQEINDRHEVILRAGTKVIGLKSSPAHPPVFSRGATPIVRDHRGKGVRPVPPPRAQSSVPSPTTVIPPLTTLPLEAYPSWSLETPLELQDEQNRGSDIPSGQVFSLDGDSIILAADRTRVVKVQNHRGANRTPLVVGKRDLADNEFWTFASTDKTNRKPTSGFVRVPQEKDFVKTVSEAKPGAVIEVDPTVSIDLSNIYLSIPEGVTIRSNRRGTNLGAQLWTTKVHPNGTMLEIGGNDVRVTGLRLRGPSRGTDGDGPNSKGILARDQHLRSIIDHNEISDWTVQAVDVYGDTSQPEVCHDHRDPRSFRTQNVRVARNFIHHNRKQEKGYGVEAHYGGFPLVEGNIFYENRHAIMADGKACTSYRAWHNLVLSAAPGQKKVGIVFWHTHDFDVHGTGDNGFGGRGGQFFEIHRNTFLGTNRYNFKLRGEPEFGVEFHQNISLQNQGDAVSCDECGQGINKFSIKDNQFKTINPTTSLGVGDFDGDGRDDLFLATGMAWHYAPAGIAEWRFLNAQTDGIGSLLFGDFDADGRTDVFTQRGLDWLVSWAGASPWEKINVFNQIPLSEYAIGDFNGDRLADVFYADGKHWYVSYGGNTPFTMTQDSSYRVKDLGFGDFNGDGKTDVVGVVSSKWMVSLNATGSWGGYPLRPALTKTMAGLIIADFNGNGRADVAKAYGNSVSYDGRGNWTDLPARPGMFAAVGRFDAKPGVDIVFYWTNDNHLGIQSSGNGAAIRHSRQHMR